MISNQVYRFCRDDISLIKNYEQAINDTENVWDCHHINELTFTKKELIKMNMYYKRPASELIFLTKKEHGLLHTRVCAGHEEWKRKNKENHKGMSGKKHTKETLEKMSKSRKLYWENKLNATSSQNS